LPSQVKQGNRVAYPGGKAINHKTLAAIPRNPTKNNKKNFLAGWNRLGIGWGCSEPQWLHFNAFLGIHSAQWEHFLLARIITMPKMRCQKRRRKRVRK